MRSSIAPRTALIVEHHAWLRSTLISLFEEIGYAVASASNGITGLRLANEVRPNLVVLGTALPELSIELLAAELRALRHVTEMQVILTSDLLRHVLRKLPQSPRESRSRDQLGAYACASKRRLSAPHRRAATSSATRASNENITTRKSVDMAIHPEFLPPQFPASTLMVRSPAVNAE
jgi:CheY-like chemotaxis protein